MNKKGQSFPLTMAITLSLLLILTGCLWYFRLMIITRGVEDALQDAVISAVNDNYDEVYHSVREGYAAGYEPFDDDFAASLDYGDIYTRLDDLLGTREEGAGHIKEYQGKVEYILKALGVRIKNAPRAQPNGEQFKIYSRIQLQIPIFFQGDMLPPLSLTIKNSAGYTSKF